jgi:hypothetical protein
MKSQTPPNKKIKIIKDTQSECHPQEINIMQATAEPWRQQIMQEYGRKNPRSAFPTRIVEKLNKAWINSNNEKPKQRPSKRCQDCLIQIPLKN